MSIELTQPLQPISPIQQRESMENAVLVSRKEAEVRASAGGSTAVTLSEAQSVLTKPSAQDINMSRVEELKQAIRDGKLSMDTGKIADALLQDTQDYLKGI